MAKQIPNSSVRIVGALKLNLFRVITLIRRVTVLKWKTSKWRATG